MQNDWVKWLSITEFANNNVVFSNINLNFFYVNKNFNFCMSFSFNNIEYVIARKIIKIENISDIMQRILKYMQQNFYKIHKIMFKQINKYRKKINYESSDKVFLFSRNIIIDRFFKKFKNKMLKFFSIKEKVKAFYQLQLFDFINIHDVFHSYFMRQNSDDSLFKQV